jgi:hypothetical protein
LQARRASHRDACVSPGCVPAWIGTSLPALCYSMELIRPNRKRSPHEGA